jgi:aromatic-L-amino-acid decarboxylase
MSDSRSLDPTDWKAFRELAHQALDEAIDSIANVRESGAWQEVPAEIKRAIAADPLPMQGSTAQDVYAQYQQLVAPYSVGNRHPRFFGWVHGSGTASGMLAEMLTASLNVNAGGRDHAAPYIERHLIAWCAEMFGFPASSSGIVTTGTSMANLIAVIVARQGALGEGVRRTGIARASERGELVAYASSEAHGSVAHAFEIAGFGSDAVRIIPVDAAFRMDLRALRAAVSADRARGLRPFFICGTAGSASVGAVDDLKALADVCAEERCWYHIDGAFGALAILSPEQRSLLAGIERADSIAFDFHKWLHVPYDAGCVIVRDGTLHHASFNDDSPYLMRSPHGTGGGEPWFCEFGPELSRGFRALKVWFTIKEYGLARFGELISAQCRLARETGALIARTSPLVMLAPVTLNIVCFRYAPRLAEKALDAINAQIVLDLQERGIAVASTTRVGGKLGIHLNVMNHRTTKADMAVTLNEVMKSGEAALRALQPTG